MDIGTLGGGVVLFVISNFLIWLIQFVALKTDMKWIKSKLSEGRVTMESHEKRIAQNEQNIKTIDAVCDERHGAR